MNIPEINWKVMKFYFHSKSKDKYVELEELYQRVVKLPIFIGTAVLFIVLLIITFSYSALVGLFAFICFVMGIVFTWKASLIYFYDHYYRKKDDET